MDSRIREALASVVDKLEDCDQAMALEIARDALSLLTAEPEPCEDAIALAGQVRGCNHDSAECEMIPFDDAVALIDAYASRREQEARADERIMAETRFRAELGRCVEILPSKVEAIITGSDIERLSSAILQGTEPANEWDRLTKKEMWDTIQEIREKVGSDGTQSILADIDEYVENAIYGAQPPEPAKAPRHHCGKPHPTLRQACIENIWQCDECASLDAEPAKVSEDVERDILAVDAACNYYVAQFSNLAAVQAWRRLVARLKEGRNE